MYYDWLCEKDSNDLAQTTRNLLKDRLNLLECLYFMIDSIINELD